MERKWKKNRPKVPVMLGWNIESFLMDFQTLCRTNHPVPAIELLVRFISPDPLVTGFAIVSSAQAV
jgi:hypothetical protein